MKEFETILSQIQDDMRNGIYHNSNLHECFDNHVILKGWESYIMGLIEQIEIKEIRHMKENTENNKSEAAKRNAWRSTENGETQSILESQLKRADKISSTLLAIYYKGRDEHKQNIIK